MTKYATAVNRCRRIADRKAWSVNCRRDPLSDRYFGPRVLFKMSSNVSRPPRLLLRFCNMLDAAMSETLQTLSRCTCFDIS
jgi:hypothetical protein